MSEEVEAFDGPAPARAEIARRFLAESTPPEPSRMAELGWPKPERINQIRSRHPQVMAWAFLNRQDEKLLERFLAAYPVPQAPLTPQQRRLAIDECVGRVASELGRPPAALDDAIRCAACAVEDAFRDWRDNGDPAPLT